MPDLATIMKSIDWNSLFSGFLGSIIGALATLLATRWQVENTIRMQTAWDRKRLEEQAMERQRSIIRGLIGELSDNLEILPHIHDFYSWANLSTDAWELSRTELHFLPADIQEALRQAYMYANRYNTKLKDRRAAQDFGKGQWDDTLKFDSDAYSARATYAKGKLESWSSSMEIS